MPLCPSFPLRAPKSPSSSSWLSRQSRDPYVKQRLMYRSRSAFKLLELDAKYGGFLGKRDVRAVVDLGAAPGGWSQVSAGKLGLPNEPEEDAVADEGSGSALPHSQPKRTGRGKDRLVVAVDLLRMNPIPGVKILQGDMLAPQTSVRIKNLLTRPGNPEGKADVVLSDMAANMTGNRIADSENSLDICRAVFAFTKDHLRSAESVGRRRGGVLVLKHFAHPLMTEFRKEYLDPSFADVAYVKPDSSRSESNEGYWVCMGWKGLNPKPEHSES
ncbi:23S ribosomal RNA methyltransferase [Gloeophyllum trabeum ATCC 11539]|uniref:rRNA methyltransferase 2, mitochondrial n=1 Tax=Gloeophyllum trabeum (strain ATCC 11539 / FP-39264 / Madison 617) TaxID=670483 RepID=S7Q123_GLOTA|nr:23S ribosomal RNA methyltransferase [Gloeophyllum trabeum ATCC 11539]EPQ53217.1 23S ribosomal RNA methyltransferase [Gloeophyllum trabeum ATCC 11539]